MAECVPYDLGINVVTSKLNFHAIFEHQHYFASGGNESGKLL